MTGEPFVLRLGDCRDLQLVGGKAVNLARLSRAGFPVPEGFVVTTAAFRRDGLRGAVGPELAREIAATYRAMGAPPVAVRSSATAEDLAASSMAGQYETFLDLQGEADVLAAVQKCWASLHGDRARAYLAEHRIDPGDVAMAVVVQKLVPADVAGVLFTANPHSGSRQEMLIEASWGLGEAVVSGLVQPDTLLLDRATGAVRKATISDKRLWIAGGGGQAQPVPDDRRQAPCLTARQVHELWRLGLRVMEHFGSAQDIEWAIAGGRLWLLQSRAITTLEDAEAEERCLQTTRQRLRQWYREGRGDWVRHNLGETLPHPTPLTWSVIRRFMSGDGGYGAMYRSVGFEPSETSRREGVLELIAGRIYMDLSRAPGMFFDGFPYQYDVALLAGSPDASQGPPTVPAGSLLEQYRAGRKLAAINGKIQELARDYDRTLQERAFPAFADYVRAEKARDLTRLSTGEWLAAWGEREHKVLDEFAPQSLVPSLIAAMALERLRGFLAEHLWDEDPLELANRLSALGEPDTTLRASQMLYEIARGQCTVEKWLELNAHRAPEEFDLAAPRWREQPAAVAAMAAHLKDSPSPLAVQKARAEEAARRREELRRRLPWRARAEFDGHLRLVRRYMRFREDSKHYLLLGYDLLRDMVLEAARRLDLDGDVFLLTFEELCDALPTGFAPLHLLEERRLSRAAESKMALPHVITRQDIDALGQPPKLDESRLLAAFPLSGGIGSGPVRIIRSPQEATNVGQGYILVCPSTDPSWTPLFVNAAGLVLECGGTLSHGAVLARELGIPAVVYAGATRLFRDGEVLTVDGQRGAIARGGPDEGTPARQQAAQGDPRDTSIPRDLVPPAPGRRERRGAKLRNASLVLWTALLAAAFLLPGLGIYDLSMRAFDALLWPAVTAWGKPAAVATAAAGLAAVVMIGQWLLTDNRRLRIAKQRAKALRKLAAKLPKDSPRRTALLRLAAPVQTRVVMASLVPLSVILGPMVLSLLWFPARVDPASWNPRPGGTAYVVATVDGEYLGPVTLECDPALGLDQATPATQSLPPIRATLEARLARWQQPSDLSRDPWELQEAGRWVREALLSDLSDYLKNDIPPQALSWTLTTPAVGGRYAVALTAGQGAAVETHLVVGDAFPPERKEDTGDGKAVQVARPAGQDAPIRLVKVVYSDERQPGHKVFWAPFSGWGRPDWDAGWLPTYLLAYLLVMFLLRGMLRIP
ncbi:MAG: PEP/pyruvate-binding domain-containing protein [Thermoguttaceae bacterium]